MLLPPNSCILPFTKFLPEDIRTVLDHEFFSMTFLHFSQGASNICSFHIVVKRQSPGRLFFGCELLHFEDRNLSEPFNTFLDGRFFFPRARLCFFFTLCLLAIVIKVTFHKLLFPFSEMTKGVKFVGFGWMFFVLNGRIFLMGFHPGVDFAVDDQFRGSVICTCKKLLLRGIQIHSN